MNVSRVCLSHLAVYSITPDSLVDIEQIEHRRTTNREMEAVYFLSPDAHIVECLIADLERKRYAGASLLWTSCKIVHEA